MRSAIAALILAVGLTLPAVPARGEGPQQQFRIVEDTVLSLNADEEVSGTFQLDDSARIVFIVQPYVGDDGLFLDVWFGKDGKGSRTILYDHDDILLIDETFSAGTYEYSVKAGGNPRVVRIPDQPPQRATLYIAAEPVP